MNRDREDLITRLKGSKLSLIVVNTQLMLIATKPRNQALRNTAKRLKLEILGSELDCITRKSGISVFMLIAVLVGRNTLKRYLPKFPEPMDF